MSNCTQILQLCEPLICSMALRYNHAFGILDSKEKLSIINEMNYLYELFQKGLTNEDIAEITQIHVVKVKQIREEVTGEGFYQPNN